MNSPWHLRLFLLIFLFMTGGADKPGKLQTCHVAQLQCQARSGCQMALNNFFIHCQSLIKGQQVTSCPIDCKHALVSLLSTEDQTGLAFINCDCRKIDSCTERKKRVDICQLDVLDSMNVLEADSPPVACNLARWICEADTSCLAALQYYYDHCLRLFNGIKCTSRCRNSLEILFRQSHASKLRTCLCDGSEDYNCHALKVNTETLCLRRKRGRRQKSQTLFTNLNSTDVLHQHSQGKKKNPGRGGRRPKRRKRRNRPPNWKKVPSSKRQESGQKRKRKKMSEQKTARK
uniref:GDNF/GAS1 domain-containing protein n=1 Tax=Arion vulgaris TaxID=1028688 RepID=A0A0B6ZG99_9EUPU